MTVLYCARYTRIIHSRWCCQPIHNFTWLLLLLNLQLHHHHNHFMTPFPGPPGWASAKRELLDFMVQGRINGGRHIDHPDGCHSIQTNQCPTNSVKALKAICNCNAVQIHSRYWCHGRCWWQSLYLTVRLTSTNNGHCFKIVTEQHTFKWTVASSTERWIRVKKQLNVSTLCTAHRQRSTIRAFVGEATNNLRTLVVLVSHAAAESALICRC